MARITVEDCLNNVENRFGLVMLAVKRSKQLYAGADPFIVRDNKEIIIGLREIAAGIVNPATEIEEQKVIVEDDSKMVPVTLKDPEDY
jgi:DNA-directed RNA polymerase subunit omega